MHLIRDSGAIPTIIHDELFQGRNRFLSWHVVGAAGPPATTLLVPPTRGGHPGKKGLRSGPGRVHGFDPRVRVGSGSGP